MEGHSQSTEPSWQGHVPGWRRLHVLSHVASLTPYALFGTALQVFLHSQRPESSHGHTPPPRIAQAAAHLSSVIPQSFPTTARHNPGSGVGVGTTGEAVVSASVVGAAVGSIVDAGMVGATVDPLPAFTVTSAQFQNSSPKSPSVRQHVFSQVAQPVVHHGHHSLAAHPAFCMAWK